MSESRLVQAWYRFPFVLNSIVTLNSTLRLKCMVAETATGKNVPVRRHRTDGKAFATSFHRLLLHYLEYASVIMYEQAALLLLAAHLKKVMTKLH